MTEETSVLEFMDSMEAKACDLHYQSKQVELKAPRFAERWFYDPKIELGMLDGKVVYDCKAVIDYLHVEFKLIRKTQPRAMSE